MSNITIVDGPNRRALGKCPSGIDGLDEITGGGFPAGRPTLICGGPGCGKTLLSMEFLVRGAVDHGEPGVFVAFEETETELAQNVRSSLDAGFDDHWVKPIGLDVLSTVVSASPRQARA